MEPKLNQLVNNLTFYWCYASCTLFGQIDNDCGKKDETEVQKDLVFQQIGADGGVID
ncbi:MAG: hypothetical protein WC856_24830 [Methylococcaceae bacterium]|jgi:hypothetical protein